MSRGIVGITALIPPELVYGCGWSPLDLNNQIPFTTRRVGPKLCAWTALWRDMVLGGDYQLDKLVVVAGGDCLNAMVDGQRLDLSGLDTHYFFYPFREDREAFEKELAGLANFLGGITEPEAFHSIHRLKERGLELDRLRTKGKLPSDAFSQLISFSDLGGDPERFGRELDDYLVANRDREPDFRHKVALLGVPPINHDFHAVCQELGLQVVFDELPYEFLRARGRTMEELITTYMNYSFSRPLKYRLGLLRQELETRKVDGIIHYTQYACHHILEDGLLREELTQPLLTVQGDMPGPLSQQTRLRLEAFAEVLDR